MSNKNKINKKSNNIWIYSFEKNNKSYDFWYFSTKKIKNHSFMRQNKIPPVLEGTMLRHPERTFLIDLDHLNYKYINTLKKEEVLQKHIDIMLREYKY